MSKVPAVLGWNGDREMDLESFRGVERLLVVLAGAMSVFLGYRLFLKMPERDQGEGRFKLPGGVSIYVSRVGPGVFFALFGAAVIGFSVQAPLVITEKATAVAGGDATRGTPTAAYERQVSSQRSYFNTTVVQDQTAALAEARLKVRTHIGFLNGLPPALRGDLPARERQAIVRSLRNAKLDLVQAVWGDWGDWPAFADWVRLGAEGDPPAGLEAPAALYRHRGDGNTP